MEHISDKEKISRTRSANMAINAEIFREIIIFPYDFGKKKGSKVGEEGR